MPCGWEGNHGSGIALAMHHRLKWFFHLWARVLKQGNEHPTYVPRGVLASLPLVLIWAVLLQDGAYN